MARVVVIGGSGHVGTYLVPMLVEAGHEVVNVSRGKAAPYQPNDAWTRVEAVVADRAALEEQGEFGTFVAGLGGEIVVDMISFTPDSTRQLVEALRGKVGHFLHCGTIWVYGHNPAVPANEDDPLNPFGEYGVNKAAIESWLLEQSKGGFPATVFRPGHIVGPGWEPLNPAGNFNIELFARMRRGEVLALPNFGLETVHHVHAEDVAQLVMRAISARSQAVGQAFNAVSPQAVNLRGYAETVFGWFGHEPRINYLPYEQWAATVPPNEAKATWEHVARSPSHSIEKARRLLGYGPRWSSLAAVRQSVDWLIANGKIS